ncbi:hypothetical protein LAZ67_10001682 [Cordylochernes scorpioides]|uniref:ATP-dependent DNA helicase n=1 Tax=Cordylochernes scorpioides TaxID=51811 RepID=A0ABY6KWL5_9ARAC|nr:hypothetical protein LAZ67_10001682 [Cordylochernes scorpioides]
MHNQSECNEKPAIKARARKKANRKWSCLIPKDKAATSLPEIHFRSEAKKLFVTSHLYRTFLIASEGQWTFFYYLFREFAYKHPPPERKWAVCQAIGEAIFLSVPIALGFSMLTDCAKPEARIFKDCVHSPRVKPLCQQIQGVRRNIVQGLQRMLHQHNLLVQQFKTALENLPSDAYRVVVNADRTPPGQHPRRYNAPTANEVAVVLAGNQFGSRDIVLHQRDNLLQHVSDTHRFYDALQYPLIFWIGQEGYSFHIPQIDPNTRQPLSSKVSSMDFYGYFIMVRRNSPNVIVQFGQLFHQFLVDMYAKVESERLRYITLHQRNLRAESYIHLRDALSTDANINPNSLGQRIILPSSFVNSPRYLAEYTQDAFCYVRKFGRPDLFITFTSNPSWEEISAALLPGQKQLDRHDITARVFRQKLVKFIGALTKDQLYGATVAWMYSVEWQKRGLPHAHILVWLANKLRPTQIDSVICAEFPDPIQDPLLYNIVVKNMIHGPCGEYNPVSPCMKNSSCSKKYPKQFLLETQTNENGYPLYRRRAPEAGGFTAKVKIRGREEVTIDNRWVVPYSPLLSKMFCAHINVENCSSVKAIKYICKYVNKGSDQAIINLRREGRGPDPQNEVRMYQCARYISSNEAVWRLLSLPLHQRHPAVIHLAVHLENGERIYFNQNTLAHRMRNPPRTTLTAFFSLCQTDSFARTLLYPDVPQYYTWNSSAHEWRRRVQGKLVEGQPGVKRSDTIGRVYAVHVSNFECFCLRMLLHNIKGPTSFAYLKIVNGSQYETFRETCAALGLLENDNHWVVTMDEAVLCQAPTRVRQLFAILISTCTISNPQQLWITYRDEMASDILHRYQLLDSSIRYNDLIYNEILCNIEDRVVSICGKKLQELGLGAPRRNVVTNSDILRELAYDTAELADNVASMLPKLLPEQRRVFDAVLAKINLSQPIIIFLDAPGGTGKTFLLNLLLAMIRKEQNIAIAVASSGIAATLLAGGRTAHSVLKLPLTFAEGQTAVCNIRKNSDKASLLRSCKLLVWDECTMAHKIALEALDRTLQDIRDDPQPMGGLVVLLAGDFRQTLPVVTRGTPADELNACLKSSYLWSHIVKMHLTVNMRVQLHNDTTAAQFADELLKIGEGQLETDSEGNIQFSNTFCQVVESSESLYEKVFPNISVNYLSEEWLCARTILAPKNSTVLEINNTIINSIPGESKIYRSIDTMVDPDESVSYPPEFLNSLELSGTPSHKIVLKVGVPVILIRNLDPPRLCNGTRLCITQMGTNVLQARILTGSFRGEEVLIPRIPIIPNDLPFKFRRLKFPVMVAFAMTINKSQGQTLQVVADDLKWRAVGRMEAGQSQVEVAKWLNVNESVVSKIWKQFIETGTIKRKEGSGRKRKPATSEDRYLVVTAKRHREITAIQLSNELSSATGTRISRQTVYRSLHEGALFARRPMVFWAGISSSRRTPLHIFSGGTLTAQRYRDEILEPYLRPYRDQIGHNLIFMDDNARPHRARPVNEYLQSEDIRRMDWPARSPDLNPIEHVWDALGRRIGARHPSPRTLVELRTALLEEWGLLPLDLLQSLLPLTSERMAKDHIISSLSNKLLDFLEDNSLTIVNGRSRGDKDGDFTYISERGSSTIDYCILSQGSLQILLDFKVDDQLYSDHHPLVLTIKGQNFNEKKTKREDYNITRYRWSADGLAMFKMKLEELREKNIPASDDLVYTFNQRILEAMSSAKITYSIKGGPRKSKPWFDKDCYDMKKLAKESLKKYRKTNRLEDRECYASSRKKYLALLDLKRKGFDNEKQEILRNAKDSKTFWKTIALYKSTSIIQGEISIQDWLNFYRELMTTEKNLRICNLHNVISQNDPILDSEITNADIYKEIAGLRSNKACGPDGIPNEVLKTLPDSYILLLKQLYNSVMTTGKYPAIWTNSTIHPIFKNGYKNSPSNYRGESRMNLQKKIKILKEYLDENLMTLNESKSKIMVFRNGGKPSNKDRWFWNDKLITITSRYTYLGFPLTPTITTTHPANYFKGKALTAINATHPILIKSKAKSINLSTKLFDTIVRAVLMYSAPLWATEHKDLLDSIQDIFIRRFLNLPRYTPGYLIRLETGRISLSVTALKLTLKYWLRVLNMSSDRLPRICFNRTRELSNASGTPIGFIKKLTNLLNNNVSPALVSCDDPETLRSAIIGLLKTAADQSIQNDLTRMDKSKLYSHYKDIHISFMTEGYLLGDFPFPVVRLLAQVRILSSFFRENHTKMLCGEDPTCTFCNSKLKNEITHYIFDCSALKEERRTLMLKTGQLCASLPSIIDNMTQNKYIATAFYGFHKSISQKKAK